MARFASRGKGFRSRKPFARKRTAWVTCVIDHTIEPWSTGELVPPPSGFIDWVRLPLLDRGDWESNEFLAETATLVRVVTEVQLAMWLDVPDSLSIPIAAQETVQSMCWQQPWFSALVCGDVADAVPGFPIDMTDPVYYLGNDVMKTRHGICTGQVLRQESDNLAVGGFISQGHNGPNTISMSTKLKRRLREDTALYLDVQMAGHDIQGFTTGIANHGFLARAKLHGTVRLLVQFG